MTFNLKFWVPMTLFQIVFGLTVFTVTRQYYTHDPDNVSATSDMTSQSSRMLQFVIMKNDPTRLNSATFSQLRNDDPVEISRRADEFFIKKQYVRAAELYERLLVFGPNNVETYNNLGITLHYLGRSTEAILRLNEGVDVDPTHQRIWLTLGFVNIQLGNTEQARTALNSASKIDPDNEIGKSAIKMLADLP